VHSHSQLNPNQLRILKAHRRQQKVHPNHTFQPGTQTCTTHMMQQPTIHPLPLQHIANTCEWPTPPLTSTPLIRHLSSTQNPPFKAICSTYLTLLTPSHSPSRGANSNPIAKMMIGIWKLTPHAAKSKQRHHQRPPAPTPLKAVTAERGRDDDPLRHAHFVRSAIALALSSPIKNGVRSAGAVRFDC